MKLRSFAVAAFAAVNAAFGALPEGYEPVEFVAANGAQYVDTGVASADGLRVDVDFMYTRNTSRCILGAADGDGASVALPAPANAAINRRYRVETTLSGAPGGSSLYLFARNDGGAAAAFAWARLYSAKIVSGGETLREYVPCRQTAGGALGLYETKGGTFHPSEGERPFFLPLRVGMYGGWGGTGSVFEWYKLLDRSPEIDLVNISAEMTHEGSVFGRIDCLVMPGGSSYNEMKSLGDAGQKNLKDYIRNGGRYYGTCAGSHLVLHDELNISGYKYLSYRDEHTDSIDIELTEEGQTALRLPNKIYGVRYSRGPFVTDGEPVEGANLSVWGKYKNTAGRISAKGDYPMEGKYAMLAGTYGSGRLFVTTSHPESHVANYPIIREGMRWLTDREDLTVETAQMSDFKRQGLKSVFYCSAYSDGIYSLADTLVKADADPRFNLVRVSEDAAEYRNNFKNDNDYLNYSLAFLAETGADATYLHRNDATRKIDYEKSMNKFKNKGGAVLFVEDGYDPDRLWATVDALASDTRTAAEKTLAWNDDRTQTFTGGRTFEGLDLRVSKSGECTTTFADGEYAFTTNSAGLGGGWVYWCTSVVHRVVVDNARVRAVRGNHRRDSYCKVTEGGAYNSVANLILDIRLGSRNAADGEAAVTFAEGLGLGSGSGLVVDARGKAPGRYPLVSSGRLFLASANFLSHAVVRTDAGAFAAIRVEGDDIVLDLASSSGEIDRVDWIEADGSQFFDTGVLIQDETKAEVDYAFTALSDSSASYMLAANGIVNGALGNREYLVSVTAAKAWQVGNGGTKTIDTSVIPAASVGTRYLVTSTLFETTLTLSVANQTAGTAAKSSKGTGFAGLKANGDPRTLGLFAMHTGSTPEGYYTSLSSARLYGCQIWTNGTLARDYVPAYHAALGKYGLFDRVTKTFQACVASDFSGATVPENPERLDEEVPAPSGLPEGFESVAYVAANGAQYIDTEVAATDGLQVTLDFMYTRDPTRCLLGAADVALPAPADAAIKRRYQVETTLGDSSGGRSLYLFARNEGGTAADFAFARIYGAKIAAGGETLREYVPCRRTEDGVLGLYDFVGRTFCPSLGEKAFFLPLRVGVYGGKGATGSVVTWYQLVDRSPECDLVVVSPALAQAGGVFGQIDLLVMPGGSSKDEFDSLGTAGQKNVKSFIANGGLYFGTCAGSHMLLQDLLNISGYKTLGKESIDKRTDVRFNADGMRELGITQEVWNLTYASGPFITNGTPVAGADLKVWGTYTNTNGRKSGTGYPMEGKYAFLGGTYKSGRIIITSSHPEYRSETAPDMTHLVQQGFRWLQSGGDVTKSDITIGDYTDGYAPGAMNVFLDTSYSGIHSGIDVLLKVNNDPRMNLVKGAKATQLTNALYMADGKAMILPAGVIGVEGSGADADKAAVKAFKDRGGICLFEDDGLTSSDIWAVLDALASDNRTETSLAWTDRTQSFTGDRTFTGLDLRVATSGESTTTFADGAFAFKPNAGGLGGDWVYCADSLVHRVVIDNALVTAVRGNHRRSSYCTATADGVYTGVGATHFEITLGSRNTADGPAALTFEQSLTIAAKSTIAVDARGKAPGTYKLIEAGELKLEASSFVGGAVVTVDEGGFGRLKRSGNAIVLEIDEAMGEIDKVDWIASTGTQYIDTEICMQDRLTIDAEFELKAAQTKYGVLFGAYQATGGVSNRYYFGYLKADGTWRTAIETGSPTDISGLAKAAAKTRYHLVETVNGKNVKTTLNDGAAVTTAFSVTQKSHPYTCYLLAHRSGDNALGFLPATLYGAKIYTNSTSVADGVLARDYVPAYRVRSGEYGLYDRVTKTFTASAAGAFVGATVPENPERLDEAGNLPTVDGKAVEPAAVFETARTVKPITYPSEPEVSGEVGEQTIAFGGVSVSVPRHYTATLSGNTVTLALNDFARPVLEDSEDDKKAIAVGETTVSLHVGKRIDGLFYRVVTASVLGGEWQPVTEFLPVADFTVDRVKSDSAAFYKIEASDWK